MTNERPEVLCFHSNGPEANPGCVSCWRGQAERCEAENQRLRTALRYIERPTMGLDPRIDPETFAGDESLCPAPAARSALQTCIRTAREALK